MGDGFDYESRRASIEREQMLREIRESREALDRANSEISEIRKDLRRRFSSDDDSDYTYKKKETPEEMEKRLAKEAEEREKRLAEMRARQAEKIARKAEKAKRKQEKWEAKPLSYKKAIICLKTWTLRLLIPCYILIFPLPLMMLGGFMNVFIDFMMSLDFIYDNGASFLGSILTLVMYPVSFILIVLRLILSFVLSILGIVIYYLGYFPSLLFSLFDVNLIEIGNHLFEMMGFASDILPPI